MNTNLWNRIRYSAYAPVYDVVGNLFNADRQRSIELLKLQPNEHVLLLGAGTGGDLEFIPPGVHVTAVDITPAMVARIEQRADDLAHENVQAQVMDGQALDLPDATFDAVVLHLVLAVIPDPYACIAEATRVLKPGGRVTVFDKFLPDNADASLFRRAANVVTGFAFSEINRKLQPIVDTVPLTRTHQEPARFESLGYQITVLEKTS